MQFMRVAQIIILKCSLQAHLIFSPLSFLALASIRDTYVHRWDLSRLIHLDKLHTDHFCLHYTLYSMSSEISFYLDENTK